MVGRATAAPVEAPGQLEGEADLVATIEPHGLRAASSYARRMPLASFNGTEAFPMGSMVFPSMIGMRWGSILALPAPHQDEFEHHVAAQPSFELREKPPMAYAFQITSMVIILSMMAAAVVDFMLKTGRM